MQATLATILAAHQTLEKSALGFADAHVRHYPESSCQSSLTHFSNLHLQLKPRSSRTVVGGCDGGFCQAQSIRLHRQDRLLRGPIAHCIAQLQEALHAGAAVPYGPNMHWPALYSLSLAGHRFVDAREFQRHYREHLDAALKSCKVQAVEPCVVVT